MASQLYRYLLPRFAPMMTSPQQAEQLATSEPLEALVQVVGAVGSIALLLIVSNYLAMLLSVAATEYALPQLLGGDSSVSAALRKLRHRFLPTTLAFVLSVIWGVGALLLCSLPGVLLTVALPFGAAMLGAPSAAVGLLVLPGMAVLVLGWMVSVLWYVLRFLLVAQVLAAEDVTAWGALRRSGALLRGRIGPGLGGWVKVRASIVVTATIVIVTIVSAVTGLPAIVLQLVNRDESDPFAVNASTGETALRVAAELLGTLGQAAFGAIYMMMAVWLYLDLRMRREGLDLELRTGEGGSGG
jgi:hypothetical protein